MEVRETGDRTTSGGEEIENKRVRRQEVEEDRSRRKERNEGTNM